MTGFFIVLLPILFRDDSLLASKLMRSRPSGACIYCIKRMSYVKLHMVSEHSHFGSSAVALSCLMHRVVEDSGEEDERDKPCAPAIVSKGDKGTRLKILHQKFCAEICCDARYYHAHKHKLKRRRRLPKQLWYFERA